MSKKPRRVRVRRREKLRSFSLATCAWEKIPLRLPVRNFGALRRNYARSRLGAICRKIPKEFSTASIPPPSKRKRIVCVCLPVVVVCPGDFSQHGIRKGHVVEDDYDFASLLPCKLANSSVNLPIMAFLTSLVRSGIMVQSMRAVGAVFRTFSGSISWKYT